MNSRHSENNGPTVREALANSPADRLDTECLLAAALQCSRASLHAHLEWRLDGETNARLQSALRRRGHGEPLAYITGIREFWSLPLQVTPEVLIPRPETECLVERTLALAPETPCRILDLGTGSGAIALALARERPDAEVTATEKSPKALEVARANANALQSKNVRFAASNWYEALVGARFDLIVSNPPYVSASELAGAQPELAFEPEQALHSGHQGMAALEHIIANAPGYLVPGGRLLVEHGAGQTEAVAAAFKKAGFEDIRLSHDLAGLPRVTAARRAG